jgi:hypothetical protein
MSCQRKRRFRTKSDAKKSLARVQGLVRGPTARRTYKCLECGSWHLTSQAKGTHKLNKEVKGENRK